MSPPAEPSAQPAKALRAAVLLSGGGRTLQNFLDRARAEHDPLPLEVLRVISSAPGAYGLERAAKAGIPTALVERRAFPDVAAFTAAVFDEVRASGAEWVLLAGYLKLLRPIPPDFAGRVLNVHPSLIPAFCGKGFYGDRVHKAVLESGVRVTGCTVHVVDDHYDHGPILDQAAVRVEPGDTVERLAARVFAAESELYPSVLRRLAAGTLRAGQGAS